MFQLISVPADVGFMDYFVKDVSTNSVTTNVVFINFVPPYAYSSLFKNPDGIGVPARGPVLENRIFILE